MPPLPILDCIHPHGLLCSDADAVCQHVSVLSATSTHSVANPLAVVQQLLNATAAAGYYNYWGLGCAALIHVLQV